MTSNAVRPGPRHRAPSRWCRFEGEVTVDLLVHRNLGLLLWYWLREYRREHAGRARRVTVLPRTTGEQRTAC